MALAAHTPAGEARGRLSTPRQARPTSKLALASGEGARKLVNRTLRAGSVPGVYDFLDVAYPVESALDSGLWNAPVIRRTGPIRPTWAISRSGRPA